MAELILMERGMELMNVPPAKVDAYLEAGWKVIPSIPDPEIKSLPSSQTIEPVVIIPKTAEKLAPAPKKGKAK